MSAWLKQSTTVTVRMGPFLDKTDGVTEETGITPVVEVSKGHGAFAARNSATAITHDAEGWFAVELDTTDTGTVGKLIIKAHDNATHLPVWHEFMVLPANTFDSLVAGTDKLQVDATQIEGTDATNQIRDSILSDATKFAGADIASILTDTAEIGAAGAGLTAIPWNAAWDAEVESEANDALVALGLDHLVSAAVVGADVTDNSIVAKLASSAATADWDTFVNTTDSLQALADATVSAANANLIADHVLRRNTDNAENSSDGDTVAQKSLLGAIGKLTHRIVVSRDGSTVTIYKNDDATTFYTQKATTDPAADPITSLE